MKQSTVFLYTLRDAPADTEVPSHRLLAQAGFIHRLAAGIYSYTPALWRVLLKITAIVREEMNRAGAQEVMLPILQPREIWDNSGRWERYVSDGLLFRLQDRKDSELCLGPTHEEAVVVLADQFVNSYKQLPLNLYQIQTKFRDEIRPRFGLMRAREFLMKDAYSFDVDETGLDLSYGKMADAYNRIFKRCGLTFSVVDADSGSIGGSASQEFVVTADTGEDLFLICEATGYAANQERAISELPKGADGGKELLPLEEVHTPNARTVEELKKFFPGMGTDRFVKTVLYKAVFSDCERMVAAAIRGDQEINEVKLTNCLGAFKVILATPEEILRVTSAEVGYAGPVGLPKDVQIIADESLRGMTNFEAGGNKTDYHLKNVNLGRDFNVDTFHDIRLAREGELSIIPKRAEQKKLSDAERKLISTRGIEVGHIFKLGTKYSSAMNAMFTDVDGKQKPFAMGCYGIGISRVAAAAVEQSHDEKGISWPLEIAPWQVHLLCVNSKDEKQREIAESLYEQLCEAGVEVLYDDRNVSAGVKFNDADLIGVPLRINVGRDASKGQVEFLKRRLPKEVTLLDVDKVFSHIKEELASKVC